MSSFKNRVVFGFIWNIVIIFSTQGSTFISNFALAKILGKIDFGKYGYILATIQMASQVFNLALSVTANKFIAKYRDDDYQKAIAISNFCLKTGLISGIVAGFVVDGFIFAHLSHQDVFITNKQKLIAALCISVYLASTIVIACEIGILQGAESLKRMAITMGLFCPITIASTVIGAKYYHTPGAVLGLCLPYSIVAIIGWSIVKKLFPNSKIKEVKKKYKYLLREMFLHFSIPSALSGLTYMPSLWFIYFMLANNIDGFVDCGSYTIASNLRALCILAPSLMNNVFLSILSNHHNKTIDKQKRIYWINLIVSTTLSIIPVVILSIILKYILLAYGYVDIQIYQASVLIIMSSVIEVAWLSMYQVFRHKDKMWRALVFIAIPRDAVFCLLAVALVPRYGLIGASVALISGHIVCLGTVMGIRERQWAENKIVTEIIIRNES